VLLRPQYLYGAKKMNMISTGAFQTEMDASIKQETLAEAFVRVWEKKNSKVAKNQVQLCLIFVWSKKYEHDFDRCISN
jgi:lambda repressor-like predicted transcriptional regulator